MTYKWGAEYEIIDNFLSEKHLKECEEYFKQMSRRKTWNCSENFVPLNYNEKFLTPLVRDLYETYSPILLGMLRRFAPEKEQHLVGHQLNFQNTTPGMYWNIHEDVSFKLLSTAIYIAPEKNTGTILYSTKEGDDEYEIDWKVNRCFAFSRNKNTWHSYHNKHEEDRYALVWNLVSC